MKMTGGKGPRSRSLEDEKFRNSFYLLSSVSADRSKQSFVKMAVFLSRSKQVHSNRSILIVKEPGEQVIPDSIVLKSYNILLESSNRFVAVSLASILLDQWSIHAFIWPKSIGSSDLLSNNTQTNL